VPLGLLPGENESVSVRLLPIGSTPPGFVRVVGGDGPDDWFWIQEREVTCGEYAEFLSDPATRAEIAASATPIRFPRDATDSDRGGLWREAGATEWRIPPALGTDFPVLGVSFEDALAYVRWRSARDGRAYALPTRAQYVRAGSGRGYREYAFGNVWSPHWTSSCFARRAAHPEPVMSFPTDESPLGAYDLTGSAGEWLDDWFDERRGLRRIGGQGWGQAGADGFRLWSGYGLSPTASHYEVGLRLVIPPAAGPR
jgi:formylglycine-generating enzyme required for sulfatase activity